jgi:hypothetical protein
MSDSLALGGGPYHFFRQELLHRGVVQHGLRKQLLELTVLVLDRPQPFGLRYLRPAVLAFPVVQRRFRSPALALGELMHHKKLRGLLSDEHFSVDGTQIQAWASMKSFTTRDCFLNAIAGTCYCQFSKAPKKPFFNVISPIFACT